LKTIKQYRTQWWAARKSKSLI